MEREKITLGKSGMTVGRDGFGALPIQRVDMAQAVRILHMAFDAGISLYDSARGYSDSEEKLGAAFAGRRDKVVIATKTHAKTVGVFWQDLETSLRMLRTDYIDIYQLHNPGYCPRSGDGIGAEEGSVEGLYDALLKAKQQGKIRAISLSNHRLDVATEAVESGLFDTLQFPFSYLADAADEALVRLCKQHNVGFIAMKALSGGLITDMAAARSYLGRFDNVVPIWGIQRESELVQLIALMDGAQVDEAEVERRITQDKKELAGEFCRACGYCLPCPAGIEIGTCARINLLARRAPGNFYTPQRQAAMAKIEDCINCGHCVAHCPYGLDTPALLRSNLAEYRTNMPPEAAL